MGENLPRVDLGTGYTRITAIATGREHTCAILDNTYLKCWGLLTSYEHDYVLGIGNGEMGNNLPVVDLGTNAVPAMVIGGDAFGCVQLLDGRIKCWGFNAVGTLGSGDGLERGDGPGEMGDALPALPFD